MKRFAKAPTFALLVFLLLGANGLRAQPTPRDTEAHFNLPYVENGHERQVLDLYVPNAGIAGSESKPLIVWIHGGAWRAGSKNRHPALPLIREGFAVASINYRLSQHAIFPAQIHDCKAAIRWLRAHADQYGYDASKIGVWGSSAGGHLVAMLGTTAGVKELEGDLGHPDRSSRVQAVCDYFGPANLFTMNADATIKGPIDHNAPDSPESKLIGGPVPENKAKADAASPITYVTKDDAPFLIVHGDLDPLVALKQSVDFHAALEKAGVDATLNVIKGGKHGGFREPEIVASVIEFFKKHLTKS